MNHPKTKLVGILNVTPDSFSDGGKFSSFNAAILQLKKMLEEGADVIDIGAESTRPQATKISDEEEWKRLEKILPAVVSEVKKFNEKTGKKTQTSIDSYHFSTIKKAHEIGVDIVNDVSGLIDKKIIEFIAEKNLTTILMHNLSIPTNPDLGTYSESSNCDGRLAQISCASSLDVCLDTPRFAAQKYAPSTSSQRDSEQVLINPHLNVVEEILNWAREKISYLEKNGVKKSQLIFDVGIGFGKNAAQSIRILKNIDSFRVLGLPLYVGHSKKSFLDELDCTDSNLSSRLHDVAHPPKEHNPAIQCGDKYVLDRTQKTLIISKYLAQKNVEFLRVHDVKENLKTLFDNNPNTKTKSIFEK